MIAIAASLWMCGTLIHDTWVHWRNNLTTFDTEEKSAIVENIPFPTVTICPLAKIIKDKFDISSKFIRAYEVRPNLSDAE